MYPNWRDQRWRRRLRCRCNVGVHGAENEFRESDAPKRAIQGFDIAMWLSLML